MKTIAAQHEAPDESLAKKTTWSAAGTLCSLAARFITQVIIARMLGPEGVGRIAYMFWLIEIVALCTSFGLPSSFTRFMAELHGQNSLGQARSFAGWIKNRYLVLTLLGAITVACLCTFFANLDVEPVVPALLALLLLARGLETISVAHLVGQQRFDQSARVHFTGSIALVLGVTTGAYWNGLVGALLGYILASVLASTRAIVALGRSNDVCCTSPPRDLQRRVVRFALYSWVAMLVSAAAWSRMEIFFLERYWNPHEIAMFTIALTFPLIVQQASSILSGALMSHFSYLVGSGHDQTITQQYQTATRLMAVIVFPIAFGGAAVTPILLPLFFGKDFDGAVSSAVVLTALSAISFAQVGSALVYAKEQSRVIVVTGFAGTLLTLALAFLLIPQHGVWGATLARSIGQTTMVVMGVVYLIFRLNVPFPFRYLCATCLAALVSSASIRSLIMLFPVPYALPAALLVGVLVYFMMLRTLSLLTTNDIKCVRQVFSRRTQSLRESVAENIKILKPTAALTPFHPDSFADK
jgi:O-antigen/teichoic acid export membrane protein